MQRSFLAPLILGAAVIALLAMQVATSMRLAKLQDQIGKLEAAPPTVASVAKADGTGATDPAAAGAKGGSTNGATDPAGAAGAAGAADTGSAKKPASRKADGSLSEKEIEKLIDKKLAERDKKNPFAQIMNFEDPLVVMERELKLSPIQKTRIAQHFKERDDATMELWQTEEGRKDWRGTEAKAAELRKTCEESVKRELDLAQQDKYEELKKAGKISDFGGAGMSIVIDRKDGNEEAPGDGK
ncbi:MAG: hypothetical protein FD180_1468 [Planctomycetota bacterium]|nr:MAG: hypothetical protein FD180_1468 [Planctomycetota bacterium]